MSKIGATTRLGMMFRKLCDLLKIHAEPPVTHINPLTCTGFGRHIIDATDAAAVALFV